jgi:hypothetical protein
MGKEKSNLEQKLKMRIDTSNKMLYSGRSMVNTEIMSAENRETFDVESGDYWGWE